MTYQELFYKIERIFSKCRVYYRTEIHERPVVPDDMELSRDGTYFALVGNLETYDYINYIHTIDDEISFKNNKITVKGKHRQFDLICYEELPADLSKY